MVLVAPSKVVAPAGDERDALPQALDLQVVDGHSRCANSALRADAPERPPVAAEEQARPVPGSTHEPAESRARGPVRSIALARALWWQTHRPPRPGALTVPSMACCAIPPRPPTLRTPPAYARSGLYWRTKKGLTGGRGG